MSKDAVCASVKVVRCECIRLGVNVSDALQCRGD
jgi:hypothetical protein